MARRPIYVTGLPRAGSTLLCQLLDLHPDIESAGLSSPLCGIFLKLRAQWSDNEFLLASLDVDFDQHYARLERAWSGFMQGYWGEGQASWVVDKHRAWLSQIETVASFDPDFRMLVCVREPTQILGSIEAQHARTPLLDFLDHSAHLSRLERADRLFAPEGVVGGPLRSIEALSDVPVSLQSHLYYVVFEHLMEDPVSVMAEIHHWLGLAPASFDPNALPIKPHESDSHYRFKYRHNTHGRIDPPKPHDISHRIQQQLHSHFPSFYQTFYPGLAPAKDPV